MNYAQNLEEIQALEALVCIFVSDAMSIVGGNWQIFDRMINVSGAKLLLDTPVTEIREIQKEGRSVWKISSDIVDDVFDSVVLASPYVAPSC